MYVLHVINLSACSRMTLNQLLCAYISVSSLRSEPTSRWPLQTYVYNAFQVTYFCKIYSTAHHSKKVKSRKNLFFGGTIPRKVSRLLFQKSGTTLSMKLGASYKNITISDIINIFISVSSYSRLISTGLF